MSDNTKASFFFKDISVNVKRQAMRFFVLIFSFLFAFASALSAGEAFEAVKDGIQGAIDDVKEGFEEFKVILLFENG